MKIKNLKNRIYDNKIFRYGGLFRNFDFTFKDWKNYFNGDIISYCYFCSEKFNDNEHLYAGFFDFLSKDDLSSCRYRLMLLCKKCAYELSDNVIEP